jgi:hydroxymethylpyrimidine pyrophosphatase-like HAD family hydrolase
MPNGEPEPTWQRHTERLSREHGPTLAELETAVRRHADEQAVDVRCRQVCDEGLPLYLSVKHNDRDAPSLAAFNEALRPLVPAGWRVHLNANNLAVLPPYLDKSHAVRHVSRQMLGEHAFTLALGDSLSDLPFMAACDYAMTPGDSQIVRELFGAWT